MYFSRFAVLEIVVDSAILTGYDVFGGGIEDERGQVSYSNLEADSWSRAQAEEETDTGKWLYRFGIPSPSYTRTYDHSPTHLISISPNQGG